MLTKDEERSLINRINDLCKAADQRRQFQFTEFLDMTEATRTMSYLESLKRPYRMYGGYKAAERQLAIIYSENEKNDSVDVMPVSFVRVTPISNPYLRKLTHRDYLGALMNLGIERRVLGDILLLEDGAVIICMTHIEAYIVKCLSTIGQSEVVIDVINHIDLNQYQRDFKLIRSTVASLRLDSIVKVCSNKSRGDSATMIRCGKVSINAREVTKTSTIIQEGQILSIRGLGKFKISHIGQRTKKNRIVVEIDQYI